VSAVKKHDKKLSQNFVTNPGTFLAAEEPTNHPKARHFFFECALRVKKHQHTGTTRGMTQHDFLQSNTGHPAHTKMQHLFGSFPGLFYPDIHAPGCCPPPAVRLFFKGT
jgi:hypothetical protein